MSQALSEFRAPVGQEALRLRMVAMHGREDPLLDAGRFARLLRQANDAEVADVRKVGDDDYEIALQRQPSRPMPQPTAREEQQETSASPDTAVEAPAPAGKENGQRLGLRFRRGSRAPVRPGEIPLIGLVSIESPVEQQEESSRGAEIPAAVLEEAPPEKPVRARPRRKRATVAPAESSASEEGNSPAPAPPKRPRRPRPRKKAE
jgi:hypothetical protein